MKNLRKQLFSNYEIEGLFGTEDLYHEYTLNRISVLDDKNLTEAQKAEKLKALFNQLPEDWKENLQQLNKLEDLRKLTQTLKRVVVLPQRFIKCEPIWLALKSHSA